MPEHHIHYDIKYPERMQYRTHYLNEKIMAVVKQIPNMLGRGEFISVQTDQDFPAESLTVKVTRVSHMMDEIGDVHTNIKMKVAKHSWL